MKIIEILNKMAKGEQPPKKIMYRGLEYMLADDYEYYCVEEDKGLFEDLFSDLKTDDILNKEVTILETTITYNQDDYYQYQPYTGEVEIKCNSAKNLLESGKIEKIPLKEINENMSFGRKNDMYFAIKINELIDKVERL